MSLRLQVSGTDIEGREVSVEGLTVNLSRGGACLRLGPDIPLEEIVTIRWEDERGLHEARACLRWKERYNDQWQVGVKALGDPRLWIRLLYFAC